MKNQTKETPQGKSSTRTPKVETSDFSDAMVRREKEFGHMLTAEEIQAMNARSKAARENENNQKKIKEQEKIVAVFKDRGERYQKCTLGNFNTFGEHEAKMLDAIDKLRDYAVNIEENIRIGKGVILYGPRGTGKDHLMSALMRRAAQVGETNIQWKSGVELFADARDCFSRNEPESQVINPLKTCKIFALSDPSPVKGNLTDFQASLLYRIVDARYSARLTTWITINVQDSNSLDQAVTPVVADRLIDGSLKVFCNWDSFRKLDQ